ncbi:MAG TPA: carboxypeptidase-like regulatory domain-containing protein, partial [Myxococcaceae bacterium]|nr:carboxypeptidase-like regulatory domain-containing protein [Myxococcaceae bacterium]
LYSETKLTAPASGVEVVLKAGAGLEVVVVDEEDQPVADATCTLVPDAPWPNGWETFSLTDEQGRAVISGLMGGRYLLMATPPWKTPFRMADQRVELRENERRQVRLRFEQGVELAGVVVDGEGKPVAGAEVRTLPEAILGRGLDKKKSTLQFHYRRLYDEWEGKAGRPALTGPDGRFVLRHLRPETYRLSASKLGYVMDVEAMGEAFAAEGHKGLRVKAGTDKPARLVLSYRGFIRGRVVGSGGQPLTEFELDGQPMRSEDGTFVVGVRQFGPHMLRFIAPGRAVTWRRADMAGRDVELGDVVLEEGGPVRVQVVEAEGGGPVERAQVQVWAEEDGQWFQTGIAEQTGQDGTVRLPAMEPRRLELVVRHSDYRGERMPLAPGQREVTVTLKAGAVLQGWLRTDEGPVRHGKVNLYEPGGRWVATLQATDGWYTQRGLAPGRYVARAWSPSLPEPTVYRPREVDVPEDGVVELDFQSEPRGSVLKVQVSEEVKEVRLVSGRFQPTSLVELRAGLPRGEPWEKDYERHELGRDVFFFRGLAPGRYTLLAWRVRRERLEVHREEVEVSATAERTLELQPRWRDMGHAGENGREMWVVP